MENSEPPGREVTCGVQPADTLMLTFPNQLGVDYNAKLLRNVAKHIAPAIGWAPSLTNTAAEGSRTDCCGHASI